MEEENSVFGTDAKNADDFDSEEKFDFCHKNKENNITDSSKELTDYTDLLSQDVPDLSEEEINAGIEKILKTTHPTEKKSVSEKSKKVTFKVLFIAAMLSVILLFSGFCAVGNSHDISIENGFATFAKDTVKIVFFGEKEEEFIPVSVLLTDLEQHGYKDIAFPQEFATNLDKYKSNIPAYSDDITKQVLFSIYSDSATYSFGMYPLDEDTYDANYLGLNDAETLLINGIYVYLFSYDNGRITAEFIHDGYYCYFVTGGVSYSEMTRIVKTIE